MDYRLIRRQKLRIFLALALFVFSVSINDSVYPRDYTNDTLIAGGNVYNGDCLRAEGRMVCYTTWRVADFDTGVPLVLYIPPTLVEYGDSETPPDIEVMREIWAEENDFEGVLS